MVEDFAAIWSYQATTFQVKKRMVRLLIEDVTLNRDGHQVEVYIRFKTGTIVKELFRIPSSGNKPTAIDPEIIRKIDHLSSEHTAGEIAKKLNKEGVIHPTLGKFDTNAVVYLLRACEKIPARSEGASGRVWQGAGVPIAGSVASST